MGFPVTGHSLDSNDLVLALANETIDQQSYKLNEAVKPPMFFIALKWRLHITFVMRLRSARKD